MSKKRPFQVYLDERDQALLEDLAVRRGLSMAETVREAVRRWATDDAAADPLLDLIGSVDTPDVPDDLSTRHDEYAVRGYRARRVAEEGGESAG